MVRTRGGKQTSKKRGEEARLRVNVEEEEGSLRVNMEEEELRTDRDGDGGGLDGGEKEGEEEDLEKESEGEDEEEEGEEVDLEKESEGEGEEEDGPEEEGEEEGEEGGSEEEGEEGGSEEEGEEGGSEESSTGSEQGMSEAPLQPLRMYFPPSEYMKKLKIGTRCYIAEALKTLDELKYPLTAVEREYFEEHPQFKHIFHMPREKNHKVMGMWMLLLRTACIEKKKEAWFVVNGTPIRYSIKEHALISGLNCLNYPMDYKKAGSEAFLKRQFKGKKTIRYQDVKNKLQAMEPGRSRDRLKMAVLFFLSSIVKAQTKTGADATPVEPFFVRAVDDLNFCKTFPWGRLSFDHMLEEIEHTMSHFNGTVKGTLWPISGFCIPLELLAFEAIPDLGNEFLETNPEADESCPRMCKRRFKKSEWKEIPLSKIYKALGTTVDIDSILPVIDEEKKLMAEITEEEDDDDKHDVVVDSWMRSIRQGLTISLEDMYGEDVATRAEEEPQVGMNEDIAANDRPGDPTMAELIALVNRMGSQLSNLAVKVDGFDIRFRSLEASVKELQDKFKIKSSSTW